ncbi:MAG: phospholipase D family protein, partial [Sinobacterium sp.]|nr:phospholipase D family protein [Sinobacterium sp.]
MTNIKIVYLALLLSVLSACSSLPTNFEKPLSYAYTDTSQTALGIESEKILTEHNEDSKMYLLNEGTDAFFARMLLLKTAERSIDVQYYIWRADLVGKLLLNEIMIAADRGVRVRILQDDINVDAEVGRILYAMDQHENISVYLYNPFTSRSFRFTDFLTDGRRVNRRMHNKSFTVDSQVTIVGGRNIGNEYFSADEESNFIDIDVMAVGPVVNDVEAHFDLYWNSLVVYPVTAFKYNKAGKDDLAVVKDELIEFEKSQLTSKYAADIKDSEIYKDWQNLTSRENSGMVFAGKVRVVYDDPEKGLTSSQENVVYLNSLIMPHLEKIEQSFELISPYFVPGKKGVAYLTNLVESGIRVRVITNSLSSTDGVLAQSGYARHRINLLKGGVEIFELKTDAKTQASRSLKQSGKAKSALHSKIYIFDRKEVFIGSFNFDPRSVNINSEVGVIYQIPEMAELIGHTSFDVEAKNFAYRV